MTTTTATADYNRYTYGDRTSTTRRAKAAYMRAKREQARQLRLAAQARGQTYVVEGITHGYHGYQDHQCRCDTCVQAKSARMTARARLRWRVGR